VKKDKPTITYHFAVFLPVALDEDFTQENAEARATQRDFYRYLQKWPEYPKVCDVELLDYDIEGENPRAKGDDDGVEYGHPRDAKEGRE